MSLFLCALYTTGDDYKINMKSSHSKSYRNAMYYNRHMFWDKVVLDVRGLTLTLAFYQCS